MNPKRDPRLLTVVRAPSPKAKAQGTLPLTVPSSPHVPFRPNTRHCSLCRPLHPAAKGLDSGLEKWRPAPKPEMGVGGWGGGGKLQSCSCNMLF